MPCIIYCVMSLGCRLAATLYTRNDNAMLNITQTLRQLKSRIDNQECQQAYERILPKLIDFVYGIIVEANISVTLLQYVDILFVEHCRTNMRDKITCIFTNNHNKTGCSHYLLCRQEYHRRQCRNNLHMISHKTFQFRKNSRL